MRLIEYLRREWLDLYWACVVTWRHMNGRWHVFRDAPTWFVERYSRVLDHPNDMPTTMYELSEAARDELRLRQRRQSDATT